MEEFACRNEEAAYVRTPKLYQEYTTMHALVMEYIEGPAIDDKEKIFADGYDMVEIDVMEVKMDLMEVMKENKTSMPQGLTMLERHVVIGL